MENREIKTVGDLLASTAAARPDKVWLREKAGKDSIAEKTFREMQEDARKVSSFLAKQGGPGIHAGILSASGIACITAMLGTMIGGSVAVLIDPQLSLDEMTDNLNRADVTVLFYDRRFLAKLDEIRAACPQIRSAVCLSPEEGVLSLQSLLESEQAADVRADPSDCACILYTSGTTGKSKGVMLSHANLIDNATCCDQEGDENDVLLSVLPIHHAYCITCDLLLSLRYGATLCINDSPMRLVQNIRLFKPTMLLFVPLIAETIYHRIMAEKKKNPLIPLRLAGQSVFGKDLRVIFCGGAYLAPELITAYKKMGIPLLQGYGMTECAPRISSSSLADPSTGEDVGRVVKNCQVRVVDGEIQAKSPSVMMGYYRNEEATKEMFTEDGWLKTGDLGYVKDERIYITGRLKNLIILSNGENVSPEELENRFAGCDWLAEVMVYSEGEQITAEVYPRPEYAAKAEKLFRKKVEEINKSVPGTRRIVRLRLRDTEFEKTTSRKIKRHQTGEKGRLLQ